MITDLDEVFRLGSSKEAENLEFRRYLSAHHHSDREFQTIAAETQPHIDCTQCANCCRNSIVSVTKAEINAIAAYLGCGDGAVERHYTEPSPEHERILRSTPEGCVFLDGTLCMIYEVRPRVCREFPHVNPDRRTLGARPASHGRWAALCPIIYNALEEHKHRVGFHARGRSAAAE